MIRKYIIIIGVCFVVLVCNIAAKMYLTHQQNNTITVLQKKISTERQVKLPQSGNRSQNRSREQDDIKLILNKIPEELSFTRYADRIRSLIDKNHLVVEDSLVFNPEKGGDSDQLLIKYNTNIRVTGSYPEIKTLIFDIQNMSGLSYFNTVQLVRDKEFPDKVKLTLGLSVFLKRGAA